VGLRAAIWFVAGLTGPSGLVVALRMYETHRRGVPVPDAPGPAVLVQEPTDLQLREEWGQAPLRNRKWEGPQMAAEDRVVVGQTHGADDAESVLIGYLLGVEALRAGKDVVMWLTKDGVHIATEGYSAQLSVPNAPSIADLHEEYIEKGGRFFACPVCVKTRQLENASWVKGAEVKGAPSLFEFTAGGALTFSY
jgi:uncharacterized protein